MDDVLLLVVCSGLGGALAGVQAGWLLFHRVEVRLFNGALTRVLREGGPDMARRLCRAAQNAPYTALVEAMLAEAQRCTRDDDPTQIRGRIQGALEQARTEAIASVRAMRWFAPAAALLGVVLGLLALSREPTSVPFLYVAGAVVVFSVFTWRSRVRFERSFSAADELVAAVVATVAGNPTVAHTPATVVEEQAIDPSRIAGEVLFELNKKGVAGIMAAQGAIFFFGGVALMFNGWMPALVGPILGPFLLWMSRLIGADRLVLTTVGVYSIAGEGFLHTPRIVARAPWSSIRAAELEVRRKGSGSRSSTSFTLVFERHDEKPLRYLVGLPPNSKQRAQLRRVLEDRQVPAKL